MTTVRRAVILAAGMGTRFLPASKAVPKELLPVLDRPLVQYAVEEAVAAGIEEIIFVIAEGKEAIRDHFSPSERLERLFADEPASNMLQRARYPASLAHFEWVYQDEPKGVAHAVSCAREFVEGEPFALLFPDDVIFGEKPCTAQLVDAYNQCGGTVVAVQEVAPIDIPRYGIVDPVNDNNPAPLRGLVEKPAAEDAPSNLGIVGRYVLSETIFRHIDAIRAGARGELQITDAMAGQVAAGEPVCSFRFEGTRFDAGRADGLLLAGVAAALRDPTTFPGLADALGEMLDRT